MRQIYRLARPGRNRQIADADRRWREMSVALANTYVARGGCARKPEEATALFERAVDELYRVIRSLEGRVADLEAQRR
jgi:hypothetical protein